VDSGAVALPPQATARKMIVLILDFIAVLRPIFLFFCLLSV
jgi:hypothetical protein